MNFFSFPRVLVMRQSLLCAAVCIGMILISAGSRADTDAPETCADPVSTGEQKRCAKAAYDRASTNLNATYNRVLAAAAKADKEYPPAKSSKSSSALIESSQQAWEKYRDAECWGVVGASDGSARMVMVWRCLAEKLICASKNSTCHTTLADKRS